MPTPARRSHRPATVAPLSSPASPAASARRRRTVAAAATRRLHPAAGRSGDAVVIPFPPRTALPGPTP